MGLHAKAKGVNAVAVVLSIAVVAIVALAPSLAFSDELVFQDMDGQTHDANALIEAGKPVVLVFWQTWCASCKKEAPELAEAVERFGEAIQFFGVISGPDDVVDDKKVRKTATAWHHSHPMVRDRDLALTNRFKVRGTPVIIVLGEEGRELFRGYRLPEDWSVFLAAKPA